MADLFDGVELGRYRLQNRIVMAPMTRCRALPDGTPGELSARYYSQRASVGLIVSEGTQPCADAQGYRATPGIYTDAHVAGWQKTTRAIRAQGGRLFIQLMHAGRMSHPDDTPHHRPGVAPSAIAPQAQMFTRKGVQDIPTPRPLDIGEIRQTIRDFRHAARRAMDAGSDGVEIHGAEGLLLQQFLAPSANIRTDAYGGSLQHRARFAIEIATAIADEIGPDRTAIRLSPGLRTRGIDEGAEAPALYRYLVTELDRLGLAYLHIVHHGDDAMLEDIRQRWRRILILNRPGRPLAEIGIDVKSSRADMEAYGRPILANPDFVERLRTGAPMNEAQRSTFYGGSAMGYTDYPTMRMPQYF